MNKGITHYNIHGINLCCITNLKFARKYFKFRFGCFQNNKKTKEKDIDIKVKYLSQVENKINAFLKNNDQLKLSNNQEITRIYENDEYKIENFRGINRVLSKPIIINGNVR